jgi:protein farnesyltransferase/geranylgeranyltransferase type-1 subunit alpha
MAYKSADWADVTPLAQVEGADALFSISYDAPYAEVFGYLRAVLASGERSLRVLALTGAAVALGPTHYTAWHVRRECLPGDAASLCGELDWLGDLVRRKGAWKNYQVWHHRRLVAERLGDVERELVFTALAFEDDEKNYHAWAHRQWALLFRAGGCGGGGAAAGGGEGGGGAEALWEAERAFAGALLTHDVHNNSAWNHRWFTLTRGGGAPHAVAPALRPPAAAVAEEVAFSLAALRAEPRNEAAWSHLRALVAVAAAAAGGCGMLSERGGGAAWAAWPDALAFAAGLCGAGAPNAFALEALAEEAEARGAAEDAATRYDAAAAADAIREDFWRERAAAARAT